MSASPVEIPLPAQYLPTGDHAMIVAWTSDDRAVLCLEDGSAVFASLTEFKFDWRYDHTRQRFVDVSGAFVPADDDEDEEESDGDTDQEPPSDGGPGVPGRVPEADRASEGGPGESGDQGSGGLDSGS